jgi:N-acetyl-gamma-glutamyl-phosphate reductase
VATHPRLSLTLATSDKLTGQSVALQLGVRADDSLSFLPNAAAVERAGDCDVVMLATSADVSMHLARVRGSRPSGHRPLGSLPLDPGGLSALVRLRAHRARVARARALRAAGALRSAAARGPRGQPGVLPDGRAAGARAAPCARVSSSPGIVVDAKSGVTGAGRQTGDAYSFVEVDGDVRAYKVLAHQHTPEIARALSLRERRTRADVHARTWLPVKRGLLATCYARPRAGTDAPAVMECLAAAYAERRVRARRAAREVMLKRVVGTNRRRGRHGRRGRRRRDRRDRQPAQGRRRPGRSRT